MQKYSKIVGLPVLCAENSKKIGVIKDVIFCPRTREVAAFLLERRGCSIHGKVLPINNISRLGTNAVVVQDRSCISTMKEFKKTPWYKDKGNILGIGIFSKDGDEIGVVEDILFDYKTGIIEGVEVSDGLIQDIVKGRKILPLIGKVEFSAEMLFVDKDSVEEMLSTGGGIINKFSEKILNEKNKNPEI